MKKTFLLLSALIIIALAGFIALVMQTGAKKLPVRQYFPKGKTVAVWDWHDPTLRSKKDLRQLNQFYYLHQINTVYVDIGSYAYFMDSLDKTKKAQLEASLAAYIDAVKNHNIRVFAAAGNTDWSKPEQRKIPLAIQQFVNDFNAKHKSQKISGLEFDIESYNQTGFPESSNTEKSIVLTELLNTVESVVAAQLKSNNPNLEIGFAIPYWFDNENGNIPSITWQGKTGPTLYHLLDELNSLKSSNVATMAYRNTASGNDGTISHARTEVDYAQTKAPNVKVLIGQEVNSVEPSKITFYGLPVAELSSQVNIINEVFKKNSSYNGIALNDLAGLQRMYGTNNTLFVKKLF